MTITKEQQAAIAAKLEGMILPAGLGDEDNACSIAAINLALTGQLTDKIPDCMSPVIGQWIISVQDAMPAELRNSPRWKELLPLAAGTGRAHEQERLTVIMDWMWVTVLPSLQPLADKNDFGTEWRRMTTERSSEMAMEAAFAAGAAWALTCHEAAAGAAIAGAATVVKAKASFAAHEAGGVAASAASAASGRCRWKESWDQFDPCGLLERLIAVGK